VIPALPYYKCSCLALLRPHRSHCQHHRCFVVAGRNHMRSDEPGHRFGIIGSASSGRRLSTPPNSSLNLLALSIVEARHYHRTRMKIHPLTMVDWPRPCLLPAVCVPLVGGPCALSPFAPRQCRTAHDLWPSWRTDRRRRHDRDLFGSSRIVRVRLVKD
jgi:hypothetical protein